MIDEEGDVWEPRTATESFISSLVNGTPVNEDFKEVGPGPEAGWVYRGEYIYEGIPSAKPSFTAIGAARVSADGEVLEMPLQGWRGPLRRRLNNQVKEVRDRLEDPRAVMIVVRGRVYSARSLFGVVWLYLKTKLFGLPKPPKEKKLKNAKEGK